MLSVKLLGLQLDNKLNFNLHISNICKSAANQLNALVHEFWREENFDKQLFYGQLQLLRFSLDAIQCKFTEKKSKVYIKER